MNHYQMSPRTFIRIDDKDGNLFAYVGGKDKAETECRAAWLVRALNHSAKTEEDTPSQPDLVTEGFLANLQDRLQWCHDNEAIVHSAFQEARARDGNREMALEIAVDNLTRALHDVRSLQLKRVLESPAPVVLAPKNGTQPAQ